MNNIVMMPFVIAYAEALAMLERWLLNVRAQRDQLESERVFVRFLSSDREAARDLAHEGETVFCDEDGEWCAQSTMRVYAHSNQHALAHQNIIRAEKLLQNAISQLDAQRQQCADRTRAAISKLRNDALALGFELQQTYYAKPLDESDPCIPMADVYGIFALVRNLCDPDSPSTSLYLPGSPTARE